MKRLIHCIEYYYFCYSRGRCMRETLSSEKFITTLRPLQHGALLVYATLSKDNEMIICQAALAHGQSTRWKAEASRHFLPRYLTASSLHPSPQLKLKVFLEIISKLLRFLFRRLELSKAGNQNEIFMFSVQPVPAKIICFSLYHNNSGL